MKKGYHYGDKNLTYGLLTFVAIVAILTLVMVIRGPLHVGNAYSTLDDLEVVETLNKANYLSYTTTNPITCNTFCDSIGQYCILGQVNSQLVGCYEASSFGTCGCVLR